ncbi:beta-propeller fold lactonase family protein [Kosakonia sp. S42]|nr:beta-propeller fold lactonase family protein [Kosakonia sp. S42]
MNQVDIQGNGPVYLSLTLNQYYLMIANYVSGSISVLGITP